MVTSFSGTASSCRKVSISLASRSLGSAVLHVLESCDLVPLVGDSILKKLTDIRSLERFGVFGLE